ncbi:MAG: GntR family transcriptional regulator [Thermoflexales bacterium]
MSTTISTLQQQAYTYVKDRIMSLAYKPGQVVTDADVAAEIGISRTPVREAFQRLENEGLLVNEARRGWRVYRLSLSDIHEIFEIKVSVEGAIARKAAACQNHELRRALKGAIKTMRVAADAADPDAWLKSDFQLHDVLFEMASNERARRIIANLNDQWHRVRQGYVAMQMRIQLSTQEHETFVASILSGDGDAAETQFRQHLQNVRWAVVNLLETVVLPFSDNSV